MSELKVIGLLSDSDVARFMVRVLPEPMSGCWLWMGAGRREVGNEYGTFYANRTGYRAHRASYSIFNGQIPDGMLVCHKCDNPICVNPQHLFVGTAKDNALDCSRKNRVSKAGAKTYPAREIRFCPQGHPYRGENLYVGKNGIRYCKECRRLRNIQYRRDVKARSAMPLPAPPEVKP